MSTALTTSRNGLQTVSDARKRDELLRHLILPKATPEQLELVLAICERYQFDPLLRHVLIINQNIYVTRDGLRHMAWQSGMMDGYDPFEERKGDDGKWVVTVKVWRKGIDRPFVATAYQAESENTQSPIWRSHPRLMTGKVAEVIALRMAFGVSLGGAEEIGYDGQGSQTNIGEARFVEVREVPPASLPAPGGPSEAERARAHALKQFGPIPETLPEVEAQLAPLARQVRTNDEALAPAEYARYHDLEARRKELLATAPAPPAFDYAVWSHDLDVQARDGVALGDLAAQINRLRDDLSDEHYNAVMLWYRQVKAARKAARATDEALLAAVVNAGEPEGRRADAARYFLGKATDAERLTERVAQLTVLDFPSAILDVLVAEQRERLGLPDDDAGDVIEGAAEGDDEPGNAPF